MQRINELLQALVQMRIEKGLPIPNAIEFESPAVVVTV
jgi:predicted RNase H-like HicB family nuclease